MKQKMKDWAAITLGILVIALIAGGVLFAIAAPFFLPCSWIDWMPVKDMPGRCLPGGRG
jgi:hypothetical protein